MNDQNENMDLLDGVEPMETETEHLPVSYISLLSGTSKLVKDRTNDFRVGDIVITPDNTLLTLDDSPGFRGVICYYIIDRRGKDGNGNTICKGFQRTKSDPWQAIVVNENWKDKCAPNGGCEGCPLWQVRGSKVPKCDYQYNFFVIVTDGAPEGEFAPPIAVLSIMGASGQPAGRFLVSQIRKDGGYPFRSIYEFKTKSIPSKSSEGTDYDRWTVSQYGAVDRPTMEAGRDVFVQLKSGVGKELLLPMAGAKQTNGDTSFEYGENVDDAEVVDDSAL